MTTEQSSPVILRAGELQSFVETPLALGAAYRTIEVQELRFTEPPTSGLLVKVQHWSGQVDLYHDDSLPIDSAWFAADPAYAHLVRGKTVPTDLSGAEFHVDPRSTHVALELRTLEELTVGVVVRHTARRDAAAMFVPTPILADRNPPNLRLLHMSSFRCLPRTGSVVEVTVDGEPQPNEPLLLPTAVAPLWATRSCAGCLLAAINSDENGSQPRGERATVRNGAGFFAASLGEPFDPAAVVNQSSTFAISSPLGIVTTGRWSATRVADSWAFALDEVKQDWSPGLRHPFAEGLAAMRRHRRRNQRWRWQGPRPASTPSQQPSGWAT